MKSFVYEMKLQMVVEPTAPNFSATTKIRNGGTMPHRAIISLLRRVRT
jgi:hypothetical protein